jgi:hypothetical protein
MCKSRPICFVKDILSYLDLEVRPHADEIPIEGGVVKGGKRETVLNPRVAAWLSVGNDVRSV